jgi:short-subunit dehydrogenase
MRPLNEQVIVITGATSGIGRAAARMFAQAGAKLIIAARGEEALDATARELRALGAIVHTHTLDVSNWDQVEQLAHTTVEQFGRIDTWVNDAAVSMYGFFDATSPDEMDRIIGVNVLGLMYGMRAALPIMKRQRYGTIINMGSLLSQRGIPLQSVYVASKHAVKGITESVRQELKHDGLTDVHLTLIMPASINTPFFTHARSTTGRKPMPMPPVYTPELAAETIVKAATVPTRDIYVGGASWAFALMERISPTLLDTLLSIGDMGVRAQQTDQPPNPLDNLFHPVDGPGAVTGEWGKLTKPSVWTRVMELQPSAAWLVPAAAIGLWVLRTLRR